MQTFFYLSSKADWSFFQWVRFFIVNNYEQFLSGAAITLLIAISATILGSLIGFVIGVIRTIPKRHNQPWIKTALLWVVKAVFQIYIDVFRGTPMMVQAMVIYYGAAKVLNLYMPPITAGIIIVSINTGAYMAEIVRGGIESISRGQFEAARTLGMSHTKTMFHVVIPQAFRNILPATGNEFIINIKDTSVLSVISVTELFFATRSIAGTYMAFFEAMSITCAIYFVLTFVVSRLLRLLEKKLDGPSSYTIYGSTTAPESTLHIKEGKADA